MARFFTVLSIFIFSLPSFAQKNNKVELAKSDFIIYSVKEQKEVKPKDIIKEMKTHDVLFFGEEHNDSIGHQLQILLFQLMYKSYGQQAALSLEMFDRDVQYIMNEYLEGKIKESYFNKDSRKWSNYKDYRSMVEFAKENGLDVVCANAPFRYVNVATRGGVDALMQLSNRAKEAMAPLPYNVASGKYADKLDALMTHDTGSDTTQSDSAVAIKPAQPAYNMKPGQSLWDATMAYSIHQYLKEHANGKVLHLNGKFHTDEYFGIFQRLAEYNAEIKPLVISLVGDVENYPNIAFEEYTHLGDYIIFTDPSVAKSF